MPTNFDGMSASDFRDIISKNGSNDESKKAFEQFFGKSVNKSILDLLINKLTVKK
jgi:hypothetical protein